MEWHYAKHGKQEGPVDTATLQSKLQSGELAPTDLVWKEGMAEWKPAGEVPELSAGDAAPGVTQPSGAGPATATGPVAPQRAPVAGTPVPNYLVPAILVTVLCCLPFGIPAIVYAAKVDGLVSTGDLAGARHASEQAKKWSWIAGIAGVAGGLAYLLFVIVVLGMNG